MKRFAEGRRSWRTASKSDDWREREREGEIKRESRTFRNILQAFRVHCDFSVFSLYSEYLYFSKRLRSVVTCDLDKKVK